MLRREVAVIIPAYNEGAVIAEVVSATHRALARARIAHQIIVVNDCSSDDTADLAADAGAKVLNHLFNTGSGGATATGLLYAKRHGFSTAATLDGDGQHDPSDLIIGIKKLRHDNADLLIGSRLIDASGMPRLKLVGNAGLSLITYSLFGVRVTDSQSGLRIFSHTALQKLRWKNFGYSFCSEMLWRAKQQKLTIAEFPIRAIYTDYSKAKGQNNWNALAIIRSLIKWRVMELFNE